MTPFNLSGLLDDSINQSTLGWTLCFIGEDQSKKLAELTQELIGEFSEVGDGKKIPSGFSYWGIGPTIAWDRACKDRFYLVMKESIESFSRRWRQIYLKNLKDKGYHYVSLGVGTGEKDQHVLKLLMSGNPDVIYLPIDMSSEMLRLGVQEAIKGTQIKGSHVLPIQIDFSTRRNVDELRKLFDRVLGDGPILFSLLGNTLANFQRDTELLQMIATLMRPEDRLLLELAVTEKLTEKAAQKAANEYSKIKSFREFVTSALLQNTDLHIDSDSISFDSSIEKEKAILVKVLYRNLTGTKIIMTLPDLSNVDFEDRDTIQLLLTRKYSAAGIEEVISESELVVVDHFDVPLEPRKDGFGINLILLAHSSENSQPMSVVQDIWSSR